MANYDYPPPQPPRRASHAAERYTPTGYPSPFYPQSNSHPPTPGFPFPSPQQPTPYVPQPGQIPSMNSYGPPVQQVTPLQPGQFPNMNSYGPPGPMPAQPPVGPPPQQQPQAQTHLHPLHAANPPYPVSNVDPYYSHERPEGRSRTGSNSSHHSTRSSHSHHSQRSDYGDDDGYDRPHHSHHHHHHSHRTASEERRHRRHERERRERDELAEEYYKRKEERNKDDVRPTLGDTVMSIFDVVKGALGPRDKY